MGLAPRESPTARAYTDGVTAFTFLCAAPCGSAFMNGVADKPEVAEGIFAAMLDVPSIAFESRAVERRRGPAGVRRLWTGHVASGPGVYRVAFAAWRFEGEDAIFIGACVLPASARPSFNPVDALLSAR